MFICVFVAFYADFSNVPDVTTGLKRSQTDGALAQVPHGEKTGQTFGVRCCPKSKRRTWLTSTNTPLQLKWGKEMGVSDPSVHPLKQTFFFSFLNGNSFLIYLTRGMLGRFDKDSLCSGVLRVMFHDPGAFLLFFPPTGKLFWNVVTLVW